MRRICVITMTSAGWYHSITIAFAQGFMINFDFRPENHGNDLDKNYQPHFAIHSTRRTQNEKTLAITPFSLYNIKRVE